MTTPFYELQARAKAAGLFVVPKPTEYLLYRQMPAGVSNQLIGKRKHFDDMVSLVGRAARSINDAVAQVTT